MSRLKAFGNACSKINWKWVVITATIIEPFENNFDISTTNPYIDVLVDCKIIL